MFAKYEKSEKYASLGAFFFEDFAYFCDNNT